MSDRVIAGATIALFPLAWVAAGWAGSLSGTSSTPPTGQTVAEGGLAEHKFGRNPACSTTEENVAVVGSAAVWLAAEDTVRIKAGGSGADTAAGAGAQSVWVACLDDTFTAWSEELATAGASASASTTGSCFRLQRAWVGDVGSYTSPFNAGAITIETTSGTAIGQIALGEGQTQKTAYTVPAAFTAYFQAFSLSVNSTNGVDFRFYQRQDADDVSTPFTSKRLILYMAGVQTQSSTIIESPRPFPAGTDLWWTCDTTVGTSSDVAVQYDLWLVPD